MSRIRLVDFHIFSDGWGSGAESARTAKQAKRPTRQITALCLTELRVNVRRNYSTPTARVPDATPPDRDHRIRRRRGRRLNAIEILEDQGRFQGDRTYLA